MGIPPLHIEEGVSCPRLMKYKRIDNKERLESKSRKKWFYDNRIKMRSRIRMLLRACVLMGES